MLLLWMMWTREGQCIRECLDIFVTHLISAVEKRFSLWETAENIKPQLKQQSSPVDAYTHHATSGSLGVCVFVF